MNNEQPQLDLGHELPEGHPDQAELPLPEEHEELPAGATELLKKTKGKVRETLEYEGEGLA